LRLSEAYSEREQIGQQEGYRNKLLPLLGYGLGYAA
jgi:hypothetical protein